MICNACGKTNNNNTISFGITLDNRVDAADGNDTEDATSNLTSKDISSLGSMLFSRCVSGTRIVPKGEIKTIEGIQFVGFGSSVSNYTHSYMTAACAIGISNTEINNFFSRLDKTLKEYKSKMKKKYNNKLNKK